MLPSGKPFIPQSPLLNRMGFRNWLFGKQENALAILSASNERLEQLLFLEKKHSAELLAQLSRALGNGNVTAPETVSTEPVNITPKEQEVLKLFEQEERITSATVTASLGYSCRQISSARLSRMLAKGLLKKVGSGKQTAYVLP